MRDDHRGGRARFGRRDAAGQDQELRIRDPRQRRLTANDYACDSADVEINGSGSVDLAQIAELAVEIHGSGDVTYRGEPKLRRMEVHGSGGVRQL